MIDTDEIATMCKALGDPTRLQIFLFLRDQCCPVAVAESGEVSPVLGPTVGEVCCRVTGVDRITSTLSHHLKELRIAGLITVERRGKNMICGVRQEALQTLGEFFTISPAGSKDSGCCE